MLYLCTLLLGAPTIARALRYTSKETTKRRVIVHITGRSTWNNARKRKQNPLTRLARYFCGYKSADSRALNRKGRACATYAIGPWGEVIRLMEDEYRPWSACYPRAHASKRKARKLEVPRWWAEEWQDIDPNLGLLEKQYPDTMSIDHPVDLIGTSRRPNFESLAIECVQWGNQYLLTRAQYRSLSDLLLKLCERWGIPHNRLGVVGHEDLTPWTRGDAGGGWDPGALRATPRFDWQAALTLCHMPAREATAMLDAMVEDGLAIDTPERPDWLKAAS